MQAVGTFDTQRKQALERTFGYIGASSTWSLGLFLFFFYVLSTISFLSDALRNSSFDPLWLAVSGAGFIPPLVIGCVYRFGYLAKRNEKPRPYLNLLIAGIAGSSRNLSVGWLAMVTNLDLANLWAFRFFGGFVMGVAVYSLWAVGNGSKIEYLSSLKSLSEAQLKLAATRRLMSEHLAVINDGLQERTRKALLPQLNTIRELLGSAETAKTAVDELRTTITEQIRPMMQELSIEQPKQFELFDVQELRHVSISLPTKFTLKDKIQVVFSSLIELLGLALWLVIFGSPNGLLDLLALFLIYFSVLTLFKFLTPKNRQFLRPTATLITLFYSVVASGANVLYLYLLNFPMPQFLMLAGFAFFCGIIGPTLLLQLGERFERRIEIENQLRKDLLAIAKENALFAQKVWVFRKRWLLVLHGSVQSSLTAALSRLQVADSIDAVLVELVKQDLHRAESAMNSNLHDELNLDQELRGITEAWRGICDVQLAISERARRALARSHDSSFCVNEIIKEAVSNAVRHGEATSAKVEVDRISDDLLHIQITNNGKPPQATGDQGIGSEMLDEICLGWELTHDRRSVRLIAEVPVKL